MEEVYAEHTVSVKIALYSHDYASVLLMRYDQINKYGLPGGHLEADELPNEALVRELDEELGITIDTYQHADFFLRGERGTSVILGYTGIAPADLVLNPSDPEKEIGVWCSKNEVMDQPKLSDAYKKFVLENWPTFPTSN